MKNIRFFLSEIFPFLVVKFSIYLNRRFFIMSQLELCKLAHSCLIKSWIYVTCLSFHLTPFFLLLILIFHKCYQTKQNNNHNTIFQQLLLYKDFIVTAKKIFFKPIKIRSHLQSCYLATKKHFTFNRDKAKQIFGFCFLYLFSLLTHDLVQIWNGNNRSTPSKRQDVYPEIIYIQDRSSNHLLHWSLIINIILALFWI